MKTWKPVSGFESHYEMNLNCEVKRTAQSANGKTNNIISPKVIRSGYLQYALWVDSKPHWKMAHRLLWETFVGPIPKGLQINHKNGDKQDNRLSNLEVVTASENTRHKFRTLGHKPPNNPSFGVKNGSAKLNEKTVRNIRKLYRTSIPNQHHLAAKFGVCQRTINLIVRKKTWGHVK